MKIELVDCAGGDLSVVNSARVSFAKEATELELKDEKLIKYLAKHKHMTPFRHNFVQLKCSVPLFLARQLMKHQAGLTWNEVSRRYVDAPPEFHQPEGWRTRPEGGIKQGSGGVAEDTEQWAVTYGGYLESAQRLYSGMIKAGIAPEQARMVLPQSMMVDFIWSGNILAFSHVYTLRIGEGAQVEAQEFAKKLDQVIKPAFPVSWKALTQED